MVEVILPVLDEAEAIPAVLAAMPFGFNPLVVDNGSSDESARVARAHGARVVHEPRTGFGAACFAGLRASNTEIVCFMDCDGSLDPSQLPLVTAPIAEDELDLCLGARVAQPGAWPWHARIGNRLVAFELRRRCGLALGDLGPMRAGRREALVELDLRDRRFGWPLEMVLKAAAHRWRVGEVPVAYSPRAAGRSKVSGSVRGTLRATRDMASLLA